MSKETQIPLTRRIDLGNGRIEVILERFRRYPVADRAVAEALGLDKDTGHHAPAPRRRRKS